MKAGIIKRLEALEAKNYKELQCMVFIDETLNESLFDITEHTYSSQKLINSRKFQIEAASAKDAARIYGKTEAPEGCEKKDMLIFMYDLGREESKLLFDYMLSLFTVDELRQLVEYSESEFDPDLDNYFNGLFEKYRQKAIDELGILHNPCTVDVLRTLIKNKLKN